MRSARRWGILTTAMTRGRSPAVAARSTGTAVVITSRRQPPVTPFDVFLNTRGARFTTKGTGLTQAPPVADPVQFPPGGLAGLFNNPTYGDIFSTFSPERLFSPVDSNITEGFFFVPGTLNPETNEAEPATVRGFGAVFTDVDQQDGSRSGTHHRSRRTSTLIRYFDADNKLLFRAVVPASPGDGSLSFFGIVFDDARIARVRITTGNVAPGPDDDAKHDVVMMDDFIYSEPQEASAKESPVDGEEPPADDEEPPPAP